MSGKKVKLTCQSSALYQRYFLTTTFYFLPILSHRIRNEMREKNGFVFVPTFEESDSKFVVEVVFFLQKNFGFLTSSFC